MCLESSACRISSSLKAHCSKAFSAAEIGWRSFTTTETSSPKTAVPSCLISVISQRESPEGLKGYDPLAFSDCRSRIPINWGIVLQSKSYRSFARVWSSTSLGKIRNRCSAWATKEGISRKVSNIFSQACVRLLTAYIKLVNIYKSLVWKPEMDRSYTLKRTTRPPLSRPSPFSSGKPSRNGAKFLPTASPCRNTRRRRFFCPFCLYSASEFSISLETSRHVQASGSKPAQKLDCPDPES